MAKKKVKPSTTTIVKKENEVDELDEFAAAGSIAIDEATAENVINLNRNVTGVLVSHPQSRDIQVDSFSLQNYGHELIHESRLELNYGLRYGLLGANGCGKSTLMDVLGSREVPLPKHMVRSSSPSIIFLMCGKQDIYHLRNEVKASDMTALEAIVHDVEKLKAQLEADAEEILNTEGAESPALQAST